MGVRFFSDRNRPVHLGPFPLEHAARGPMPDPTTIQHHPGLGLHRPESPAPSANAMGEYQANIDALRDGIVTRAKSDMRDELKQRANQRDEVEE